jgi:hypothetical protein
MLPGGATIEMLSLSFGDGPVSEMTRPFRNVKLKTLL